MNNRKMSDAKLVSEYEKLERRSSRLIDAIIEIGLGHLKVSDMETLKEKPEPIKSYLLILVEMAEIRNEAKARYGPDMMFVRQLKYRR